MLNTIFHFTETAGLLFLVISFWLLVIGGIIALSINAYNHIKGK